MTNAGQFSLKNLHISHPCILCRDRIFEGKTFIYPIPVYYAGIGYMKDYAGIGYMKEKPSYILSLYTMQG